MAGSLRSVDRIGILVSMTRYRIWGITALLVGAFLLYFVWSTESSVESKYHFKLGLDLAGGTELVYRADMSEIPEADQATSLAKLQQVIERRINPNGVGEYLVQTERASTLAGITEDRLIVGLPGVYDINVATSIIGSTPTLEFRLATTTTIGTTTSTSFVSTGLTGSYLETASVQFASGATAGLATPQVLLQFNKEGGDLFASITGNNVGGTLAIFLDGQAISTPVIQQAIPGGVAVITGNFSAVEARDLADSLKFGALPVPIILDSNTTVGATLGSSAISSGIIAGIIGFVLVALFMIFWYRLPGIVATIALAEYVIFMLSVIKFIPITLTASGIAGLIITVGMAVDANILIFERTKDELKEGKTPREAVHLGFARAWTAIRDGHVTGFISGAILFWLGTSIVKGFALVFMLGLLASLLSAVTISRVLLLALVPEVESFRWRFLMGSGICNKK